MTTWEQNHFWGYELYGLGVKIGSGQNPIPEDLLAKATEIRWIENDPSGEDS
jgi:hypothetical protein